MSNDPSTTGNGPWRILILDRSDAADLKWIIATVASASDVRPAGPGDEQPGDLIAAWARGTFTAMRASAWRIDASDHNPAR